MPRIPIEEVVDTTGCGDSFAAGMAFGHLLSGDFITAVRYGNAMGAQRASGSDLSVYRDFDGTTAQIEAAYGAVTRLMGGDADSAVWELRESGFDIARASYHETVMTVGNGRIGTRGLPGGGPPGALSGTYLAGVYDAHDSPVIDLVNLPDWLLDRGLGRWSSARRRHPRRGRPRAGARPAHRAADADHDVRAPDRRPGPGGHRPDSRAWRTATCVRCARGHAAGARRRGHRGHRDRRRPTQPGPPAGVRRGAGAAAGAQVGEVGAFAAPAARSPGRCGERAGVVEVETIDTGVRVATAYRVTASAPPVARECRRDRRRVATSLTFARLAGIAGGRGEDGGVRGFA